MSIRSLIFPLISAVVLTGCGNNDDRSIAATGTIEATEVTVSALSGGVVERIVADEGVVVRTGDTLLLIEKTDWLHQLRQTEAAFQGAGSQHKLALLGARTEDVAQAEATAQNAKTDLRRMEELAQTSSITQKQLDDARTRNILAQQTLDKLRRGSRPEEIDAARARMDQARAQRDALQKKVDDCVVRAPIDGAVIRRYVERGELAGMGTPLAKLADLQRMEMTIYVSEKDLPRTKLGQTADIRVDAFPDRSYEGKIVFISSIAEFTPKNIQTADERTKLVFAIKLNVANPDGTLKAGIPADVVIKTGM